MAIEIVSFPVTNFDFCVNIYQRVYPISFCPVFARAKVAPRTLAISSFLPLAVPSMSARGRVQDPLVLEEARSLEI